MLPEFGVSCRSLQLSIHRHLGPMWKPAGPRDLSPSFSHVGSDWPDAGSQHKIGLIPACPEVHWLSGDISAGRQLKGCLAILYVKHELPSLTKSYPPPFFFIHSNNIKYKMWHFKGRNTWFILRLRNYSTKQLAYLHENSSEINVIMGQRHMLLPHDESCC